MGMYRRQPAGKAAVYRQPPFLSPSSSAKDRIWLLYQNRNFDLNNFFLYNTIYDTILKHFGTDGWKSDKSRILFHFMHLQQSCYLTT